jgi:hypothetical protein
MDIGNEVLFHTLLADVFPVMPSIDTFYHMHYIYIPPNQVLTDK